MSEENKSPMIPPEEDAASLPPVEQPAEQEEAAVGVPAEKASVEENPMEEASVEENPVEEATAEVASVEENPTEEATAEEASVEENPTEEATAEEAPVEEAPVEETTAEEASAEEVPVEEAPVEETTAEEASAEQTKAESSADVTPPPPQTTYRWTYADQVTHDRKSTKRKRSSGVLVYSLVMTAVFLISFSMLIGVLILGGIHFGGDGGGQSILRPGISDPANDDEAVVAVEQAKRSVVVIEVRTASGGGSGTGIIMTENGYIATNHHVIEDSTRIKVTFYDGSYAYADLVGSSEMDDLAVIKVNKSGLPAATFAHSDDCYVGETVYAIGAPGGPEFGWTTTRGIVSYKDREVKMYDDDGVLQKKLRLLQTDANVNPGNSGGPLVNVRGEVVGVVSMKLADGYEGIGFAIPSDGAVEILEAIMEHGHANDINSSVSHTRPVLGITGLFMEGGVYYQFTDTGAKAIPEDELDQYNVNDLYRPAVSGIYVMGVTEGLGADGKMKPGDIITAMEGEELFSMNDLTEMVLDHYAGDTVTLKVYRNRRYVDVDIVLSAQSGS